MKKSNFLSKEFLDECNRELFIQKRIVVGHSPFAHPAEVSDSEREVAKIFCNRLLFLLYQGGRISQVTFIEKSYMVGDWQAFVNTALN